MRLNSYAKFLLISIVIVFFSFRVVTASTSIFFSSPPKTVEEGDRLSVDVRVNSPDQSINAITGSLTFPDSLVRVVGISKDNSIINLWTQEPKVSKNRIQFEGIVLNPGYQGSGGNIFKITFEARRAGTVYLNIGEGGILANDGLGTNVLADLGSTNFKIIAGKVFSRTIAETTQDGGTKLVALPVITEYQSANDPKNNVYVRGKGEPNAITKIVFKDISVKSVGERLIGLLQTKKKQLSEVLVKNNEGGLFEYTSSKNLVAGVYNATPFLVDNNTSVEKPGLGVQLLVNDSKIVKNLVIVINVLGLLIPIVGLVVIIYFIPWYSWRRMRVIKKKLGLEEEKIELSTHQMERQDKILDKSIDKMVGDESPK